MKNIFCFVLGIGFATQSIGLIAGEVLVAPRLTLQAGLEEVEGNIGYRIGGSFGSFNNDASNPTFWNVAKLEFPTSGERAFLIGALGLSDKTKIVLKVTKNITEDSGTFIDKDWGNSSSELLYDSSSETTADTLELEVKVDHDIFLSENTKVILALGAAHSQYSMEAQDGITKVIDTGETLMWPGTAITYDAEEDILFVQIAVEKNLNKFLFRGRASFIPWGQFSADDHHVLRDIAYTADGSLSGVIIGADIEYALTKKTSLFAGIDLVSLEGEGRMDVRANGPNPDIEKEKDEGWYDSKYFREEVRGRIGIKKKF